jgi:hypothetical protein
MSAEGLTEDIPQGKGEEPLAALFTSSLRLWQARWKAQRPAGAAEPAAPRKAPLRPRKKGRKAGRRRGGS